MRKKTSFLERAAIAATPYDRIRRFLAETIWHIDPQSMPFHRRWGVLVLRVVYLVGRNLVSSRTQLQASALTYTTMLAVVPAFAVVFSLFQGFGGLEGTDAKVKSFLIKALAPSPAQEETVRENLDKLVTNANEYVRSGSGLAVISLIFLILTVVSLLSTVESTMNDVWGVKRSRSVLQKFMTYWALATLGPILLGLGLVMGSSLNSWLGDYAPARLAKKVWKDDSAGSPTFSPEEVQREFLSGRFQERQNKIAHGEHDPTWTDGAKLRFILSGSYPEEDEASRFTSFVMVAIAFTLLYAFMPNTRVRLKPACWGGFLAAFAWNVSRWGLATSSSSLVKYNTIYGGLATIPIMMFWLYISWLIVILGAELTFAIQNIGSQGKEELAQEASPRCRETVALRVMAAIADAFDRGGQPPTLNALAKRLGAPVALTSEIIFHLCEDGLLREIEQSTQDPGYVPARPLERITLQHVVSSLHERAGVEFTLEGGADAAFIADEIARARAAHENVATTVTFDHVVRALRGEAAPPRLAPPTQVLDRGPLVAAPAPAAPSPEARAMAERFAALKAAEKAAEKTVDAPGEPIGAGDPQQLAALLEGASPDEPQA